MTLLNQVLTIIDEPNASKFWPIAQVYDAINECSIEVLGSAQCEITTATTTTTASQRYLTLPTTIMVPKFILDVDGREIPKCSLADLERESPQWGTATGTEIIAWADFDINTIQLYPLVTATATYIVKGVPYPTEITTGTTDVIDNDALQDAIKFMSGSVLMDATRPDLSDTFRTEGMEHLQIAMRLLRNQQSHRIWALQPASRINARRSGDLGVIRGYR